MHAKPPMTFSSGRPAAYHPLAMSDIWWVASASASLDMTTYRPDTSRSWHGPAPSAVYPVHSLRPSQRGPTGARLLAPGRPQRAHEIRRDMASGPIALGAARNSAIGSATRIGLAGEQDIASGLHGDETRLSGVPTDSWRPFRFALSLLCVYGWLVSVCIPNFHDAVSCMHAAAQFSRASESVPIASASMHWHWRRRKRTLRRTIEIMVSGLIKLVSSRCARNVWGCPTARVARDEGRQGTEWTPRGVGEEC